MKTIKNALLALLAVVIVVGGTYTAIKWDMIVDKWQTEADREVFKQTTTYSEAAASFLADSYKQYNDAETDADKNTIMEYVVMRYPNLDTNSIDMPDDILAKHRAFQNHAKEFMKNLGKFGNKA